MLKPWGVWVGVLRDDITEDDLEDDETLRGQRSRYDGHRGGGGGDGGGVVEGDSGQGLQAHESGDDSEIEDALEDEVFNDEGKKKMYVTGLFQADHH